MNPAAKSMNLDKLLTLDECAEWLGINRNTLTSICKGVRPMVPAIWLGPKTVRFHPRTILAKFAADQGFFFPNPDQAPRHD